MIHIIYALLMLYGIVIGYCFGYSNGYAKGRRIARKSPLFNPENYPQLSQPTAKLLYDKPPKLPAPGADQVKHWQAQRTWYGASLN